VLFVGFEGLRHRDVERSPSQVLDVGPRRVEVCVGDDHLVGHIQAGKENPLGRASLVGGYDVLEAGQLSDPVPEAVPGFRAGV